MVNFASNLTLRRILIPALRVFGNFNVTIRHGLTGSPMRVHVFKHKGYWFYGSKREEDTLRFVQRVLGAGQTVMDIGANIGYLTALFAHIVGESGRVVAFEPGEENLPYLAANVARYANVTIVKKAASNICGRAEFLVEDLTGQNNSLLSDLTTLERNSRAAGVTAHTKKVQVETVSIDYFCETERFTPVLVKIDVEGAELIVLQGMDQTLRQALPILIVEIWREGATALRVLEYLFSLGYCVFNSDCLRVSDISSLRTANVFCLHRIKHEALLAAISG